MQSPRPILDLMKRQADAEVGGSNLFHLVGFVKHDGGVGRQHGRTLGPQREFREKKRVVYHQYADIEHGLPRVDQIAFFIERAPLARAISIFRANGSPNLVVGLLIQLLIASIAQTARLRARVNLVQLLLAGRVE